MLNYLLYFFEIFLKNIVLVIAGVKNMPKINIHDISFDLEYADENEDADFDQTANRKQKNRVRRQIEALMERKKLREILYTEDSYWGD